MKEAFSANIGEGPLVAVAIHDGHDLRPEVRDLVALGDGERLREEDPRTGDLTEVAATRFVVHRSRFEMDLNRSRDKAVYETPEDAWGLDVWKAELSRDLADRTLAQYDNFYDALRDTLVAIERAHKRFVVFDIHSYNHRREGPDARPADPGGNPAVNVGTISMDRTLWAPVIDTFMQSLSKCEVRGRPLDVRENVRFQGRGNLTRWVHENFPRTGCAIAIEFKKTFMDEWSGEVDDAWVAELKAALGSVVEPVLDALRSVTSRRAKTPRRTTEHPRFGRRHGR